MTAAPHATPEASWVPPELRPALLDFWRVYDSSFDAIIAATLPILVRAPEGGAGLRSLSPDAAAAAQSEAREHLRRAIVDGDWATYEDDLRARAVSYARRGLTLTGWHEIASTFVCCVTPLLLRAYRDDPDRAGAAVLALQRLHDRRAIVLGEQFLRTKEDMARAAEASLRRSEADLRSARRLAAIGELAGGVAHDFNNLLTVVIASTDVLRRRVAHDEQALDELDQVRQACARATDLARQLQTFSRQQLVEPTLLDVGEVVEGTERMLRQVVGAGVELLVRLTRPLGGVKIDRGSLEQVLMNLVVNARDAMPDGGKLTIATAEVERDGAHVMLSVSDDGVGMDAATCARAFEPFFTTKGPGKGTGLGLATVRGIVEQAGGFVEVRSAPGEGTTFAVHLPCATTVTAASG
jgi:signal transduction histidine kinase